MHVNFYFLIAFIFLWVLLFIFCSLSWKWVYKLLLFIPVYRLSTSLCFFCSFEDHYGSWKCPDNRESNISTRLDRLHGDFIDKTSLLDLRVEKARFLSWAWISIHKLWVFWQVILTFCYQFSHLRNGTLWGLSGDNVFLTLIKFSKY